MFMASHFDTGSASLGLHIRKDGFYPTDVVYDLGGNYNQEAWNIKPTWVLKKIIQPIPMYAKSVNLAMPAYDKPVGFDFMAGDWVEPFGKGKSTDIVFTTHLDKRTWNDFDYKVTISFPNSGDGIQAFTVPATRFPGDGSALRSPHEAPEQGYLPELAREHNERPTKILKYDNDPNANYFFRIRTVSDEKGNVKSALYGKIYGDFMQFRYYLNPTPNDRNVEFDPKQNLMQGLKSVEQVSQP
jgi:hypothetical protein